MVDDFSRFGWGKFIREKSNAFEAFRSLSIALQNEKVGNICKMAHLRSDHQNE